MVRMWWCFEEEDNVEFSLPHLTCSQALPELVCDGLKRLIVARGTYYSNVSICLSGYTIETI
jgi:hypothetical protein